MSTWDDFERKIKVIGERILNSADDCVLAAQEIGLKTLPPSYVQYAQRFGSGRWMPGMVIMAPRHPKAFVCLRYEANMFRNDPSSGPELQRLISFGSHQDGFQLCWDQGTMRDDGEMDLRLVDHDPQRVYACGSNLLEFLDEYWVGRKLDQAAPWADGSWGGEPVFKPTKS